MDAIASTIQYPIVISLIHSPTMAFGCASADANSVMVQDAAIACLQRLLKDDVREGVADWGLLEPGCQESAGECSWPELGRDSGASPAALACHDFAAMTCAHLKTISHGQGRFGDPKTLIPRP